MIILVIFIKFSKTYLVLTTHSATRSRFLAKQDSAIRRFWVTVAIKVVAIKVVAIKVVTVNPISLE